MIYVAGSLRNPEITKVRDALKHALPEHRVFMDWYSAGPHADDHWKEFYQTQGMDYLTALKEPASINVYNFDKRYIDQSDYMVLVLPAGKSGHMELGYQIGRGKHGIILLDGSADEERWDIMYQFASLVTYDINTVIGYIMEAAFRASNS